MYKYTSFFVYFYYWCTKNFTLNIKLYRVKFLYFTNLYKDYYIYSYNIFSLLIYLVLPLMPLQIFENELLLSLLKILMDLLYLVHHYINLSIFHMLLLLFALLLNFPVNLQLDHLYMLILMH